ncbi:tRNA 2'-phosphotransferase 1 [Vespula squamosa]|uniref:2'-phosphotransferase n=1 Tax=Vespula squamosa TaxID=30214 RepID=A0ABD2A833_VESSQ
MIWIDIGTLLDLNFLPIDLVIYLRCNWFRSSAVNPDAQVAGSNCDTRQHAPKILFVQSQTKDIVIISTNNKDYVSLSKKLSYLLRHGAIKEGLLFEADGFIPINHLLFKKLSGFTLEDIKKVVDTNEKKRFILNENNGIWKIKATQGHSINEINNLPLKPLDHVDFDIIHGLDFICGLRKSADIYIYIDFEKAKRDGLRFFESENEIILCAEWKDIEFTLNL